MATKYGHAEVSEQTMIRTIIIDTENEKGMLQVRMDPHMSQDRFLEAVDRTVRDFRREEHERYQHAITPDGHIPWSALFTHCPQNILMRHGIDTTEYGTCWLKASQPPDAGK